MTDEQIEDEAMQVEFRRRIGRLRLALYYARQDQKHARTFAACCLVAAALGWVLLVLESML